MEDTNKMIYVDASGNQLDNTELLTKIKNGEKWKAVNLDTSGDVVDSDTREDKAENTVSKLMGKLKKKNRILSTDNSFLINVIDKDEHGNDIGKYSMYADSFNFQLFKMDKGEYQTGFQEIDYIKNITITNKFSISLKENPDNTILEKIYNYIFSLIKNNTTRILTEKNVLFDEVYVYIFLDNIKKHKGNHYIYKFEHITMKQFGDTNDFKMDFSGSGLINRDLTLNFSKAEISYYNMNEKTQITHKIDVYNGIFEYGEKKKFSLTNKEKDDKKIREKILSSNITIN